MDAVIMLALRIGLLALLWIFILVALNAMRRDTNKSAGAISGGTAASGSD